MTFDLAKFKQHCRLVRQVDIANALNITERTVQNKFKNNTFTINEFLTICELIEYPPTDFIESDRWIFIVQC